MKMNYSDILIDIIISTMKCKGITRVALARKLEISPQVLGKYLRKNNALPLDVAFAISSELGIDLNDIRNLKDNSLENYEYSAFLEFKDFFESYSNGYLRLKNK